MTESRLCGERRAAAVSLPSVDHLQGSLDHLENRLDLGLADDQRWSDLEHVGQDGCCGENHTPPVVGVVERDDLSPGQACPSFRGCTDSTRRFAFGLNYP